MELETESISAEEYHDLPGVSSTMLKDYADDFRLYWYKYLSGRYRKQAKAHFDFGSAVHEIALLGSQANIVVIPQDVLSASGSRAGGKWKEFEASNPKKLLLKQDDFDAVMRCVDAIYADKTAGELMQASGVCEKYFKADFPELKMQARCRPDKLIQTPSKNIVVDLKTTQQTKPESFVWTVRDFGYANQEYFYRKVLAENGIEVDAFIFIAVSVTEPHTVDCYTLHESWQAIAAEEVEGNLSSLARRMIENDWKPEPGCKRLLPPSSLTRRKEYQV
jgi:hypothetical protein